MMKAYWKDIWRSVAKGKKRFFSIALIAMLGVTMMCGLRASCEDLRYSADQFFDEQNLFDIRVLSTLGLTDEDLAALDSISEVELVDGGYNETIYTQVDEIQKSIDVRTLSKKELNQPYLLEGSFPKSLNEIVITENYCKESGRGVGDTIIPDEEPEHLKSDEYVITGIIIDAMDINSSEGAMGFRSTSTTDYVGYVIPEAADSDIYTVVYLGLEGTKGLNCYTDEYEQYVESVVQKIESQIKGQREQARFDTVYGEAMDEWLDGKQEMEEEFAKADQEIADAKKELADGKEELEDARKKLADGRQELLDGRKELEQGKKELADGEAQLRSKEKEANAQFANARKKIQDSYAEIEAGEKELQSSKQELEEYQKQLDAGKAELAAKEKEAKEQIAAGRIELQAQEENLEASLAGAKQQYDSSVGEIQLQITQIEESLLNPEISEEEKSQLEAALVKLQEALVVAEQTFAGIEQQVAAGREQIAAGKTELDGQETAAKEQFAAAWAEIEKNQAELDDGWKQYQAGVKELESGKAELKSGESELNQQERSARNQIAAGWDELEHAKQDLKKGEQELIDGERELKDAEQELADGEQELADGEQELSDSMKEYEEEKAEAKQELADAKKEIDDIDMTRWYVQDRLMLSGYANVKNDADSIQAIGDIFPILFLSVAILISLTTITRMVEEERGLIGTYKALGFTNGEIRRKYIIYAALACLIGGVLGDVGGYVILPTIIFIVFRVMYSLPEYSYHFDLLFGLGGILLFEVGVLGATAFTCRRTLSKMPAKLMRPKSPKAGSRVFLERITVIWTRLSFLNKVTARNLFRYKKRLLMTVFGICGCTALLLCGFTIKNTISEMMPQQYQKIYQYDLMAVSEDDKFDELKEQMEQDREIADYIPARIESVELLNEAGVKETVQLMVVPDGEVFTSYICLRDRDHHEYQLEDGEIFITRNASRLLGFAEGDSLKLQNQDLEEVNITIDRIVENYLGNTIYMTKSTYHKLYDKYEENGVLAYFSESCKNQGAYTDELERTDGILSAVSTEKMQAEFEPSFALINMVVYVVLVLAAMLAFVVLFTLSNTNISERERELATIKVLGFYHHEVHSYVNKETLILTVLGVLCGMPAGLALGRYVLGILRLPSLEFYITLYPESYLIAGVITMVFAFIVNLITDRTLDKINMVEALKSVE